MKKSIRTFAYYVPICYNYSTKFKEAQEYMEELEKHITDERTGLKYELIGDYYFIAGDDEPEERRPIGIWGQRRLQYIRKHKRLLYSQLQLYGKLNEYLVDINEQAENMFELLIKQMAERDGVTKKLKADNQMEWVSRMNNLRNRVIEIVNSEYINV